MEALEGKEKSFLVQVSVQVNVCVCGFENNDLFEHERQCPKPLQKSRLEFGLAVLGRRESVMIT